jgi:hypothetical protein
LGFGIVLVMLMIALLWARSRIFRETLRLIWHEPVGLVVPSAVAVLVFSAAQMGDMIAGLRDSPLQSMAYGAAAVSLGLSAWHWNRAVVDVESGIIGFEARNSAGDDKSAKVWALAIAPRLTLLPAGLVALAPLPNALAELRVAADPWAQAWPLLGAFAPTLLLMFLAFVFVWQRRALADWLDDWLPARVVACPYERPTGLWSWLKDKPHYMACILRATPFGWPVALLMLGLVVLNLWLFAVWPHWLDVITPGPVAALVSLASLLPVLVLLLAFLRRLLRPLPGAPLVGLVLLLVCFSGGWMPPDTFAVRTIAQSEDRVTARPDLAEALARWMDVCAQDATIDDPRTVVIVAAQGGASRGALWLLSVLRQMDIRTDGELSRRLFAISAVSGGGLGATTYLQLTAGHRARGGGACSGPDWLEDDKPDALALQRLGERDFLAPVLGSYFLADTLRHLPGVQWALDRLDWDLPTRATALERSFEEYWKELPDPSLARAGLLEARPPQNPTLPHLALNGTDVQTGRRLVTSTFRFSDRNDSRPDSASRRLGTPVIDDADDLLAALVRDVPLSVAVTNTARFPYVSPDGTFTEWETAYRRDGTTREVVQRRQVVDGGYFESYGATTAQEIASAVALLSGRRLRPFVLVVSNDADMEEAEIEANVVSCRVPQPQVLSVARARERARREGGRVPQALAPILGYLATRSAHARHALLSLHGDHCPERRVVAEDGSVQQLPANRMAHITLRAPEPPNESAPLNWVLNRAAREFMLGQGGRQPVGLTTRFNQEEIKLLCGQLPCRNAPEASLR